MTSSTAEASVPTIIDDKTPYILPFILSHLSIHQQTNPSSPFIIGLNGIQGAGKTTLVNTLYEILTKEHGLETLVLSIDDLYLTREEQDRLSKENAGNALVKFRGEPGTHDMTLARTMFSSLLAGQLTLIPSYDKSLHSGLGDRLPTSQFRTVNAVDSPAVRVIIFEGWCVGFRSLPPAEVASKQEASTHFPPSIYTTLPSHPLSSLLFVNEKLKEYDVMTDTFHLFIHIDALETQYVYQWRKEQEAQLRRERGSGMSDEQVKVFVDGYYPAYELYLEGLRTGVFAKKGPDWAGKQMRLVVGIDRKVKEVMKI